MNQQQKEILQSQLNDEEKVIKNIKGIYKKALDDIDEKIASLMGRTDTENLQSIIYQIEYQKALKQQINSILDTMNAEQFDTVSEYLTKCYEEGYLGTMYDLQAQGIPLIFPIAQDQVVQAVITDSKISQGLYERLGEDVGLLKRRISNNVARGIAQGASYQTIAKNIKGLSNVPMSNAMRIARTEGHRIANNAAFDAQLKAKERGADIVKQWSSTLDGRTRSTHREIDRQVRELDEEFEVAGHKARYPGDFGVPSEDCNCRCALLQRARSELKEGFLKRDNFTGEIRSFKSPEDYEQFKKWYFSDENVKYMKYVSDLETKYGTKNFNTILNKMTDAEYKHFRKLESASPLWDVKKQKKYIKPQKSDTLKSVTIKDSILKVEKEDHNLNYECGAIIGNDGKVVKRFSGKAHSVEVTDEDLKSMSNCVFTHNHPLGVVFSDNDIQTGFIKTNLSELRASTPQGITYVLTSEGNTIDSTKEFLMGFKQARRKANNNAQTHIVNKIKLGEITMDDYKKNYYTYYRQYEDEVLIKYIEDNAKSYGFNFRIEDIT